MRDEIAIEKAVMETQKLAVDRSWLSAETIARIAIDLYIAELKQTKP